MSLMAHAVFLALTPLARDPGPIEAPGVESLTVRTSTARRRRPGA